MRNTPCWTKRELYQNVDEQLAKLNVNRNSWVDATLLAYEHCHNMDMRILKLGKGLCAILHKGPHGTTLALNQERNDLMQNFDCMHELIHYFFHPRQSVFRCVEKNQFIQNPIQEWQANEGAAQALVPYQVFIPEYVSRMKSCSRNQWNTIIVHNDLAKLFNVTLSVIRNRISSLEYEIYQYLRGIPLSDLIIMSKKQLEKHGLNTIVEHRLYCTRCRSVVNKNANYCIACGNDLNDLSDWPDERTYSGVDYVIYSGIDIDENDRAITCPVCYNEEIDGHYCKICGSQIINYCTNDEDCRFHAPLPGNARFCHVCGSMSTFNKSGYLKAWDEPIVEVPF